MGDPFKNLRLQIGNVVGSYEVNELIGVGFTRGLPDTSGNSASHITGYHVRDAQDDEFHQLFVVRT